MSWAYSFPCRHRLPESNRRHMAPGKRKAPSGPGSRPPAPAAPGSPRFLPCPTCGKSFVARIVQEHAWSCKGPPPDSTDTGGDGKGGDGKFVSCPVCSRSFPQHAIESHAWGCVPPTGQGRSLTGALDGASSAAAAAAADQRSPAGTGKGARPGGKDQPPGGLTGEGRFSSSVISRGSKASLVPTSAEKMTVPCWQQQRGDAVQASVAPEFCAEGSQNAVRR